MSAPWQTIEEWQRAERRERAEREKRYADRLWPKVFPSAVEAMKSARLQALQTKRFVRVIRWGPSYKVEVLETRQYCLVYDGAVAVYDPKGDMVQRPRTAGDYRDAKRKRGRHV